MVTTINTFWYGNRTVTCHYFPGHIKFLFPTQQWFLLWCDELHPLDFSWCRVFCKTVAIVVLRSESPSGKCAKLHKHCWRSLTKVTPLGSLFTHASCYVQSLTLSVSPEITRHDHSIIACSRHVHMGVILRAHLVRGESHIQSNANREVATVAALGPGVSLNTFLSQSNIHFKRSLAFYIVSDRRCLIDDLRVSLCVLSQMTNHKVFFCKTANNTSKLRRTRRYRRLLKVHQSFEQCAILRLLCVIHTRKFWRSCCAIHSKYAETWQFTCKIFGFTALCKTLTLVMRNIRQHKWGYGKLKKILSWEWASFFRSCYQQHSKVQCYSDANIQWSEEAAIVTTL